MVVKLCPRPLGLVCLRGSWNPPQGKEAQATLMFSRVFASVAPVLRGPQAAGQAHPVAAGGCSGSWKPLGEDPARGVCSPSAFQHSAPLPPPGEPLQGQSLPGNGPQAYGFPHPCQEWPSLPWTLEASCHPSPASPLLAGPGPCPTAPCPLRHQAFQGPLSKTTRIRTRFQAGIPRVPEVCVAKLPDGSQPSS